MTILFAAPQSVSVVSGGLRRQMLETAASLERLGYKIHFLSPEQEITNLNMDLIHFFGAHPEHYATLNLLQSSKIPTVLSPVFFSRRSGDSLSALIRFQDLLSRTPLLSLSELQMRKKACELASHLLPNTKNEGQLISSAFQISKTKMTVVPNGANTSRFLNSTPALFHSKYPYRDFILYVGDLTAERKNVHRLILAYKSLKHTNPTVPPLVLAGSLGDSRYAEKIKSELSKNDSIHWIGEISHEDPLLSSLYKAASVFVLPSYFETPGIAALEAALAGCYIVITRHGGTTEYFENFATYIEPHSIESIEIGLSNALKNIDNPERAQISEKLSDKIVQEFDWDSVARQTAVVYQSLISITK